MTPRKSLFPTFTFIAAAALLLVGTTALQAQPPAARETPATPQQSGGPGPSPWKGTIPEVMPPPASTRSPAPTPDILNFPPAIESFVKSDWRDPGIKLDHITWDNLPLSEVVRDAQTQFKSAFDLILPQQWQGADNRNWLDEPIKLQFSYVTATEVFNAMNMYFEINEMPLRWELTANGARPTVLLRVLRRESEKPIQEVERSVIFVGDLMGDGKNGAMSGMTLEQIVDAISNVYQLTFQHPPDQVIQCHKQAQLLVLTGTPDELNVIRQTLRALQQRENYQNNLAKQAAPPPEPPRVPVAAPKNP
jgi:hypothetical protein